MIKLDTKGGIICTGCLSIAFAITFLVFIDSIWKCSYICISENLDLYIHISGMQILASVCLIVGAFMDNYKCFVPWMITTGLFFYLMFYVSIVVVPSFGTWIFVPTMTLPFTVYLSCAFYSVQKAFDRMRNDEPPSYTSLNNQKEYIIHI